MGKALMHECASMARSTNFFTKIVDAIAEMPDDDPVQLLNEGRVQFEEPAPPNA
jgi:hypothetical protein